MMSFGDVITSYSMSYDSVLSFAAKSTNIEDVLCVGTMRGRGHNISVKVRLDWTRSNVKRREATKI